jgi:lipopolysaccharide cholinephosphotransferase
VLYFIHRDPYRHGRGPSSWLPLLLRRFYTMEDVQQRIRRLLLSNDYEQSALVADYDDGLCGAMSRHVLGTPTPYTFEGRRLTGVEQSDTYLSRKYGDYMTIPDSCHQRQHNFHVLDLDLPYREYQKQANK